MNIMLSIAVVGVFGFIALALLVVWRDYCEIMQMDERDKKRRRK